MSSYLVHVFMFAIVCVISSATMREGDSCTMKSTGAAGVCTHISKCKPVIEAALLGIVPENICFYIGTVSAVCCDPKSITSTDDITSVDVKEGDGCTVQDTGMSGTCRRFAHCTAAKEQAAMGIFPQKCNQSLNRDDLVCCSSDGQRARKYCTEMATKVSNCPSVRRASAADNGHIAEAEKSHMALLGSGEESSGINWWCTGVLISERWVLTAARCLEVSGLKYAKLGGWTPNVMGYENLYVISRKVPHPDYKERSTSRYNDLGLLHLERAVTLSDTLYPACLHTGISLPRLLILSKWNGGNNYAKWTTERVSHADCAANFASNNNLPEGIKDATQSCSRSTTEGGCLSADGAPLLAYSGDVVPCTNLVVGIQIYTDCKLYVETKVAPNVPWIESVVWP